jgi:hypothetical protein
MFISFSHSQTNSNNDYLILTNVDNDYNDNDTDIGVLVSSKFIGIAGFWAKLLSQPNSTQLQLEWLHTGLSPTPPSHPIHETTCCRCAADRGLPDNIGSSFSVCILIWTQLERRPPKKIKKIEDDLKNKNLSQSKQNKTWIQPQKNEHDLKKINSRRPQK